MRNYFSGIAGPNELDMLNRIAAPHILLTPSQLAKVASHTNTYGWPEDNPAVRYTDGLFSGFEFDPATAQGNVRYNRRIMLDNGAYELMKRGEEIDPAEFYRYLDFLDPEIRARIEYVIAPDSFDSEEDTATWWETWAPDYQKQGWGMVPVWHWEGTNATRGYYLKEAPVVAIGGAAKALRGGHREKDPYTKSVLNEQRDRCREVIINLCACNPGRYHVLGCNDLYTLDAIKETAYSIDTSKWLDGGRYAYAIFRNTRTGKLQQAPAKRIPGYEHLDRAGRCEKNAKEMQFHLHWWPEHNRQEKEGVAL